MTIATRRQRLVERMAELGIQRAPGQTADFHSGSVDYDADNGVYFNIGKDSVDFQLLIVGPMLKCPGEWAAMFDGYYVQRCDFLEPVNPNPAHRQAVINRGFISIIMTRVPRAVIEAAEKAKAHARAH